MTRLTVLPIEVAWLPWDTAAFERARVEARPILLSIVTEWCACCREMDRTTFADPSIAGELNERFVPIRVVADRQPDISERYSLGGWPTTVFLDADGRVLGGGTFVPPDRMRAAIARVSHALDAKGSGPLAGDGLPQPPQADGTIDPQRLSDLVFDVADPGREEGPGPGFPHDAPARLALARWKADQEPRFERFLITTLDRLGWGGLYDERHGGFFRCAAGPGWQAPDTAKLLPVNAALLRLYLDAGEALGVSRFIERAAGIVQFVQGWLADTPDGGWFGSLHADAAYYADVADSVPAPGVSRIRYADGNAAMAAALLHAARVFGDEGLRAFALQSLERVLLSCYKPGDGVAHYSSDGARRGRGLLADQVAMAGACLDAHEATDNIVYEMMAEELMHYALRVMWHDETGAFADRVELPDDAGLLRTRLVPFAANCDATLVLDRLAKASGASEFAAAASRIRAAMAPRAQAHGALAAHYLLTLPPASLR